MTSTPTTLSRDELAQFERDGYVRVRAAFTPDEAAAMRDVVWSALEERGMRRDDRTTWLDEAPSHLQDLRPDPAFRAIGSERTLGAIADLLGRPTFSAPPDWGAFFLLFPTFRPWRVPHLAWHVDHDWHLPLAPVDELKVHAVFGDLVPRAGAMPVVAGSHRVVAQLVAERTPFRPGTTAARVRKAVMSGHPYLRELSRDVGDDEALQAARFERYADVEEEVLGVPLRVVEMTGDAGDVLLMHPLLLHTRATNAGRDPRFLLNKDLYAPRPT